MKAGPKAIALMHHFESCSLAAYRDAVGVATIGWGMTYYPTDKRRVQMGDRITQVQADSMFRLMLAQDFEPAVQDAIGDAPTTPAQFGAMVALAYNIGVAAFRRSSVLKLHRAGQDPTQAFLMWNRAGSKVLAGLTRRRSAEAALYRSDFDALKRYTNGEVV